MALRSARVRRASSFSSPPVIIRRATISISPRMSRWSSSRSALLPWTESEASMSSASRTFTWSGLSTSLMASAYGARLTPEPGARRTRWTERPNRLAKSASRPKLLPASATNIRGRYMASIWLMRLVRDADLPDPVGPKMKPWAFICRSSLLNGSKVNGAPPRLNSVKPGCPVPVVRPQMGDRLAMCCANIIWVYHSRARFSFGSKLQGSQRR
ncbi:hypothetical protein PAERUG_P18_London_17_VIM_2_04_10_03687 [Pseudomonas aeruginosa]|nr:hypothetical protein PAERUG_P18_London_17_VIM_2_04_10_03687 [Pseudomonas aeruginosa]